MRNITHILVHESDSTWGDAPEINRWHIERGWSEIGYHRVILNGHRESGSNYNEVEDGRVESGRMMDKIGSHAKGYNQQSIGICLIGANGEFTQKQMKSLDKIIIEFMKLYKIPVENILGHYEIPLSGGKVCPEIEMKAYRAHIKEIATVKGI